MEQNWTTRVGLAFVAAMIVTAIARPSGAQVPDYGFQWATVTHAGNRAANAMEAPVLLGAPAPGRVDYEYRISVTEVSVAQWFEFVQAYEPIYTGSRADSAFTGLSIAPATLDPAQPPGYYIVPGQENRPASMSWRFAARYVNWLSNGKRPEREAFEQGAYDASTFTQNADGTYNDQLSRAAGATFWIPSVDEWSKAVYFDPNRYGTDQPGYWMHPLGSDLPATPGLPGMGQTSGGVGGATYLDIDVGSYPESVTPWGLLDASGGVAEWTETSAAPSYLRYVRGSITGSSFYDETDRLDQYWLNTGFVASLGAGYGLRIAGVVPGPAQASVVFGLMALELRKRRKRCQPWS